MRKKQMKHIQTNVCANTKRKLYQNEDNTYTVIVEPFNIETMKYEATYNVDFGLFEEALNFGNYITTEE